MCQIVTSGGNELRRRGLTKSSPASAPQTPSTPTARVRRTRNRPEGCSLRRGGIQIVHSGSLRFFAWLCVFAVLCGVSRAEIEESRLSDEIGHRLSRVDEFRFIQEQAARLGVRVWLFGGTAAAYAHYVKQDLQREGGDARFQAVRFDYDYTNIFRSTQDLDIVVDGTPARAKELQMLLESRYPHTQGEKTAWEVRLLKSAMGDKEALLDNPDFRDQHTDSHSTGLVELTAPPAGEGRVRDLRAWESGPNQFLADVTRGKLHYYFSPKHEETKRYRDGLNPPILSAVRFLTKAFQYHLEIGAEDRARIEKICRDFNATRDLKESYVERWMQKNGKKLFQNATDIEDAWTVVERLGLRRKLQGLGNPNEADSLAWWMNKEPLRAKPVGEGKGKTARELGLDEVAHETKDYLAYESITRSRTGSPNAFISRENGPHEAAVFGDGFYVRIGHEGARGTGFTIRFKLKPEAREGEDFLYVKEHNYLVIRNKNAMEVVPESMDIGPLEFFRLLKNADESDRGLMEKVKRRVSRKMKDAPPRELAAIRAIVRNAIKRVENDEQSRFLVQTWFAMDVSAGFPDLMKELIESGGGHAKWLAASSMGHDHWTGDGAVPLVKLLAKSEPGFVISHALSNRHWAAHPEGIKILEALLAKDPKLYMTMTSQLLGNPGWSSHPKAMDLLQRALEHEAGGGITAGVLSKPDWIKREGSADLMLRLIEDEKTYPLSTGEHALSQPEWAQHPRGPELVRAYMKRMQRGGGGLGDFYTPRYILSKSGWQNSPHFDTLMHEMIEGHPLFGELIHQVIANPAFANERGEKWLKRILEIAPDEARSIADYILPVPEWAKSPYAEKMLDDMIREGRGYATIASKVLSLREWASRPKAAHWLKEIVTREPRSDSWVLQHVLKDPIWIGKGGMELLEIISKRGAEDANLAEVLAHPKWAAVPGAAKLVDDILDREEKPSELMRNGAWAIGYHMLRGGAWNDTPHAERWLRRIIGRAEASALQGVVVALADEHWVTHASGAELLRLTLARIEAEPTESNQYVLEYLGRFAFGQGVWAKHPDALDLVAKAVELGMKPEHLQDFVLKNPAWRDALARLPDGIPGTLTKLKQALKRYSRKRPGGGCNEAAAGLSN